MKSSEIIDRILDVRGIPESERRDFLNPSIDDLAPPEELPGVKEAAEAILAACESQRRIVVFGDYDCDGVCAAAIMMKAIKTVRGGETVTPFLPERLSEGYGMSDASVARMLSECPGAGLVVTVDNGINSVGQIAELNAKGVRVVVTDHHLPGEELPEADALVNPRVAAPGRLSDLCGAAVAYLLAGRLVSEAKRRGMYVGPAGIGGPLLVLAGLATVTDIMPLIGQNRILVAEALKRFRSWAPLGLRELHARAARCGADRLTSKDFGFMLGPRINAAGRLASGMDALDLVLETNRERVREYALRIDLCNTERKAIEQRMTEEAMSKVVEGAAAQVIDLPGGHPGVAGIVAARVLERLGGGAPVCVIASGRGSARSPEGLNIRDAFVACGDCLATYGGHAAAGGFTVKPGMVDAFRSAMCDYCAKAGVSPAKREEEGPDMYLEPGDVTLELAEAIEGLEPFGECNEEPVFGMRGVRFADVKPLGADGRHLSVSISVPSAFGGASGRVRAVWWGRGDLAESLRRAGQAQHDILFNIVVSEYGERHPELRLMRID